MARDEDSETSELKPAGWPRPVVGGWPIPWVSPPHDLSTMDGDRKLMVLAAALCQVCGVGHEPEGRVFVCVADRRLPPEADRENLRAVAMDDAVMHERCARLAVARCPRLSALGRDRALIVLEGSARDVDADPESGELRLHVESARVAEFSPVQLRWAYRRQGRS